MRKKTLLRPKNYIEKCLLTTIQYVDIMTEPFDVIQKIDCRFIFGMVHFDTDTIQINWIHNATGIDFHLMIFVEISIETNELK